MLVFHVHYYIIKNKIFTLHQIFLANTISEKISRYLFPIFRIYIVFKVKGIDNKC